MNTESNHDDQSEAAALCPKCLLANSPAAPFCTDCGAPLGMFATVDPIQHIHAEGFAYRSAVDGPPRLIIVIGIWLLFAPVVLIVPFLLSQGLSDSFPQTLLYTLFAVGSAVIVYRTTKNYLVKSRSATERNA